MGDDDELTPREELELRRRREAEREARAHAAANLALRSLRQLQLSRPELVPDEGLTMEQALEVDAPSDDMDLLVERVKDAVAEFWGEDEDDPEDRPRQSDQRLWKRLGYKSQRGFEKGLQRYDQSRGLPAGTLWERLTRRRPR